MSVEPNVTYTASDGREFDCKEEAERYDAFIVTRDEYLSAQRKFVRKLAETCRTADGKLFDFSHLDYYFIDNTGFWPDSLIANMLRTNGYLAVDENDELYQTEPKPKPRKPRNKKTSKRRKISKR